MKTSSIGPFNKGFNNIDGEVNLPEGSVRIADNVDFTRDGWFRRRQGYTKIYDGVGIHSLWNRFFVESGTLNFLDDNDEATFIASGLTDKPLSYYELDGEVYFSNEDNNGKVGGPWGVESLSFLPTISVGAGSSLIAGDYQVSFVNIATNGEESGATNPVVVTVPDGGSISISNIVSDHSVGVYVSPVNGEELFFQGNAHAPTFEIKQYHNNGKGLQTLFMQRAPAGQLICGYKGRMYIAQGSTLWYTEAQRPGLYKPAENFFNLPERITVLLETEHGLYVVADKTYFLTGDDPKKMNLSIVGKATGIEGTGVPVDAKDFKLDFNGKVAYWFSNKGAILGFPNGQLKYISEDRVAAVDAESGCTGYRELDGIRQLITNLSQQNPENSFGASDNVTASVIRNGIVI